MHSQNITHRDLKPDNFLINFCPAGNCVLDVKLTDFELSAELTDKKELSVFCGSHAYAGMARLFDSSLPLPSFLSLFTFFLLSYSSLLAPEICMKEEYDGVKADVWSLGVMLYIMLCGEFPWNHFDPAVLHFC